MQPLGMERNWKSAKGFWGSISLFKRTISLNGNLLGSILISYSEIRFVYLGVMVSGVQVATHESESCFHL